MKAIEGIVAHGFESNTPHKLPPWQSRFLHVIGYKTLREFAEKRPDSMEPLKTWYKVANKATWMDIVDVKAVSLMPTLLANARCLMSLETNSGLSSRSISTLS